MIKAVLCSLLALAGAQVSALTYDCGALKYKGRIPHGIPEFVKHYEVRVSARSVAISESTTRHGTLPYESMKLIKKLAESSVWALGDLNVNLTKFKGKTKVTLYKASNADWGSSCKEVKKPN